MKLDDKIYESINSIEDVEYKVSIKPRKKEKYAKPKIKRYFSIVILAIFIAFSVNVSIKVRGLFDGINQQSNPSMPLGIHEMVNCKKLYQMKYDKSNITDIKVYYYLKEKEFNERSIIDIILNLKYKGYDNIDEIVLDEEKYEIAFITARVNATLVYDFKNDKEINETLTFSMKYYSVNMMRQTINCLVSTDNGFNTFGEVKDNKCIFDSYSFTGVNRIHETLTQESNNKYSVNISDIHDMLLFYENYLFNKEKIEFNANYITLEPNGLNRKIANLVNSKEALQQLNYDYNYNYNYNFDKYDDEFFKNNALIVCEMSLEHEYGALHGEIELSNVYYQNDNLCLDIIVYKTYTKVYKYTKLVLVEVKRNLIRDYVDIELKFDYSKLQDEINDATPANFSIIYTPGEVENETFSASIKNGNLVLDANSKYYIEIVLFRKNGTELEIIYKFGDEKSGKYEMDYELPHQLLDGIESFKFTLKNESQE